VAENNIFGEFAINHISSALLTSNMLFTIILWQKQWCTRRGLGVQTSPLRINVFQNKNYSPALLPNHVKVMPKQPIFLLLLFFQ